MSQPLNELARGLGGLGLFLVMLAGCGRESAEERAAPNSAPPPRTATAPEAVAGKLVAAARREVEKGTRYEPGYHRIAYPGGDVPSGGVCTDLVIRAFRGAGLDLQQLVHEDMRANFAKYPQLWNLAAPDPHIDHRRVPNLMVFFERRGAWLPTGAGAAELAGWQPGDVVFWDLPDGLKHCGIISDRKGSNGAPLVIHNISQAAEEDCLTRWKITGHARYPAGAPAF